jgi:hypothetical protein
MGGMWKGEGANRFVAEMTSEVIPMLVNIMGFNTNFVSALKRAADRMEQAERQAIHVPNSSSTFSIRFSRKELQTWLKKSIWIFPR